MSFDLNSLGGNSLISLLQNTLSGTKPESAYERSLDKALGLEPEKSASGNPADLMKLLMGQMNTNPLASLLGGSLGGIPGAYPGMSAMSREILSGASGSLLDPTGGLLGDLGGTASLSEPEKALIEAYEKKNKVDLDDPAKMQAAIDKEKKT